MCTPDFCVVRKKDRHSSHAPSGSGLTMLATKQDWTELGLREKESEISLSLARKAAGFEVTPAHGDMSTLPHLPL